VEQVLNCIPNIPLDTLSSSGTTALYYAINHLHLKEVRTLLKCRANPKVFGKDADGLERNPLTMMTQHLEMTNAKLARLEHADGKNDSLYNKIEQMYLQDLQKELMLIKKEIEEYSTEKTCTGVLVNWFSNLLFQNKIEPTPLLEKLHLLKK
jgi:hypothetical protein